MRHFAELFHRLDSTTRIKPKVAALVDYLEATSPENALWTIALMTGKRPRRPVSTTLLREWAAELSGIPLWLFEETYHVVGDLAETITMVLPESKAQVDQPLVYYMELLRDLKPLEEEEKQEVILSVLQSLGKLERFVFI